MKLRRIAATALAIAVAIAATYVLRSDDEGQASSTSAAALGGALTPTATNDPSELDRLISVHASRAPERNESLEYRTLGNLYLSRARLIGSLDDYVLANEAFSAAVDLYSADINSTTGIAETALALHDFTTASALATDLILADEALLRARAVAGDAALAVGQIAAAAQHYGFLADAASADPAVMIREAELAYATGDVAAALSRADNALQTATQLGLGGRALAFYETYAAHLAFEAGQYDRARRHVDAAVALDPTSAVVLSELGGLSAAEGDLEAAVGAYERAVAALPTPDDLVALGDLYVLLGDEQKAQNNFSAALDIATLAGANARAYSRAYAEYLLDHEGDFTLALELTTAELERRRDAHGWDAHAWALYRNGRFDEARTASNQALATGMRDAELFYHAGVISAALGQPARAIAELGTALDISPAWDPAASLHAASLLGELQ